jgi:hypothetical protein
MLGSEVAVGLGDEDAAVAVSLPGGDRFEVDPELEQVLTG